MKVIILPEVLDYFEDLMEVLYQKEYFGFRVSARKYVIELIEEIEAHLPIIQQKPAPSYFDRYGKNMRYATFRKNKQTVWYAFFTTYEVENEKIYLVRYIANNHTVAQYL